MRSLFLLVLAALAAVTERPTWAQVEDISAAALSGCRWSLVAHFPDLVPRAVATTPEGVLLLAADDYANPARPVLVVWRSEDRGANWEAADRFLPTGATATGARSLYVDGDGAVFLLAWRQDNDAHALVLRRSFDSGRAGTWETGEQSWPLAKGGAITGTPDGKVLIAYGFAGAGGVGWRVESAGHGAGPFALEDEFVPAGQLASVEPFDFERAPNGDLAVAGVLNGEIDEWVVRLQPGRADGTMGAWRTVDRFRMEAGNQGIAAYAVVPLGGGSVVVAGAGAPLGRSDYRWLERWRARGDWATVEYQRNAGRHTLALDAVATQAGVAVLGVAAGDGGLSLLLRESSPLGKRRRTVLELPGVTDLWAARMTSRRGRTYVAASLHGGGAVLACGKG